jgi:Mg2+-importing ATPase
LVPGVCLDRVVDSDGHSNAATFKSRPGNYLLISALIVAGVTLILPYSPLSGLLGFRPLPISLLLVLGGIAVLYMATSEMAKKVFYKRVQF